jgi:O-antigen ligase
MAAALGAGLAVAPAVSLGVIALIMIAFILEDARVRGFFVIVGGVAVLQSSAHLSSLKMIYLAGVGVSLFAVAWRVPELRASAAYRRLSPLFSGSVALGALIILSFPFAILNGAAPVDWLRDSAPYLLLSAVPWLALDIRTAMSDAALRAALFGIGLVAVLGFAVRWSSLHGLWEGPFRTAGLPSFMLAGSFFCYLVAAAIAGRRNQVFWACLALIVLVGLLVSTGSRTLFVWLIIPVFFLILSLGKGRLRQARAKVLFSTSAAVVGLLLVLSVSGLPSSLMLGDSPAFRRLATVETILVSPSADASYQEHQTQFDLALRTFREHLVLGTGPGHFFEWFTPAWTTERSLTIDTALSFLAKFGLVGLVILGFWALQYVIFIRATLRASGFGVAGTALAGLGLLTLVSLPGGSPIEDKGYAFGLLLLLALSLPRTEKRLLGSAPQRGTL